MSDSPGLSVLLVDDDLDVQVLLSLYLPLHGYQVFTADNGVDAIAMLSMQPVDVILTEWRLPMLDGLRFLQWLREEVHNPVPVVVHTVKVVENRERILEAGADAVLGKPAKGEQIVTALTEVLKT